MNFIQRNPDDPRYEEFHDGEYEYWPVEAPVKTKSISNPAALISGLEMLAAVAAAGLLALALSVLYVMSAPRAIYETGATIHVNTYNNNDRYDIAYTLTPEVMPDRILDQGMLEETQDILDFRNLSSGTTYILTYYNTENGGWEQVGEFRFTTPGDPETIPPVEEPDTPAVPPETEQTPAEPGMTEETTAPETEETTPEETTPEETTPEETTKPSTPVYYPPADKPETEPTEPDTEPTEPEINPTEPSTDPTEPSTDPTEPSTDPTEPEIIVSEPDTGGVEYVPPEFSGDETEAYFRFAEYHTFLNVPEDGYTIRITHGNTEITDYTAEREADGTLRVTFTGKPIPVGKATTSKVTLTTGGKTYTSTHTVFPPSLGTVDVTVEKNGDGTHTFTIVAEAISDGTEEMVCEALLYTILDDYVGVTLPMSAGADGRYTAVYTTLIQSENDPEQAVVAVTAYWARLAPDTYYQSDYTYCTYSP